MQQSTEQIIKCRGRIGEALLKLRPAGAGEPAKTSDFISGYSTPKDIPIEYLETAANILEAEVDCRQRLGDLKYFSTMPLQAKLDIYVSALAATQEEYHKNFILDKDPVSWVEFKLAFARQLKIQMSAKENDAGG